MSLILKTQAPVYGGYVIARQDGVIFVRGAIPDEVVNVSIIEKKRDYSIGITNTVIEPSPYRIEPPCSMFGICGGCQLQFISYDRQISMKEGILLDSLKRIGGIEIQLSPSLTDRSYNYRHRAQFKVSLHGEIGFYKEGTREAVPVKECLLMIEEINILLKKISDKKLPGVKEIYISCGDTANALIKLNSKSINEKSSIDNLVNLFMESGLSGIAFDNRKSTGKDYISLDLNGMQYTAAPWSFFQSHWDLNKKVVELIINGLQPLEGLRVLDLYSGAGNFSLPFAKHCLHVIAVEENPCSVEDGQRNAKINNIENCRFIKSSAEKYKINEKFDVIILDPPRLGLTAEVMKKMIDASPKKIVYVSCNPATFARDLKKLKEKFSIDSIRMIDFFPNTYHVEALAFMSLR